jgi:hypothetical protein
MRFRLVFIAVLLLPIKLAIIAAATSSVVTLFTPWEISCSTLLLKLCINAPSLGSSTSVA